MDKPPGHRALRRGRFSATGQVYFLTTTTTRRMPLFCDWESALLACRTIADPQTWGDARLLCWVLMPDHWHGLVRIGERDPLPFVASRFKACISRAVRGGPYGPAPVWARAYHDRALRRDDDLVTMARYVILNPVRAGLVSRVNDYPFWDAMWL
ncbi:MAG: transposase [Xanthomonadales bacterium]|nr:transposase [Xanthomonadales bacterium]